MFARIFGVLTALVVSGNAQATAVPPTSDTPIGDTSIDQRLAQAQAKLNQIIDLSGSENSSASSRRAVRERFVQHWGDRHHQPFNQFRDHHDR